MILSRRQILEGTLALPFCSSEARPARCILFEDHCLAAESAAGFREALDPCSYVVVVPASRNLTAEHARQLKRYAAAGAFVLFEIAPHPSIQQTRRLATEFRLQVGAPDVANNSHWQGEYVEYIHPIRRLVRPFLSALPLYSPTAQVLARLNETPAALIEPFGRGTIVFLGSLLGPALYAGDREAHDVIGALTKNRVSSRIVSRAGHSDRHA